MRLFITCALVTVSLMAAPSRGSAQTVTWMIEGQVDSASTTAVDPGFFATFSAGSPVELLLSYNAAIPEEASTAGNPNLGLYLLPTWGPSPSAEMEAAIGGRGYYQKPGSLVHVYVNRTTPHLWYDGTMPEYLGGDNTYTTFTWKPHALDFDVRWPGFPFATDALLTAIPHNTPVGEFELYLRICADNYLDPCPASVPAANRSARVRGSFDTMKPVFMQKIAFMPEEAFPFNWRSRPSRAAIFGSKGFLPDVEIERSSIKLSGATARDGGRSCEAVDVNQDGYIDLVCSFVSQDIRPREGRVRLTARTINGNYIQGFHTLRSIR